MNRFVEPTFEIVDIEKENIIETSSGPSEQCTIDDILNGSCVND